jgi:lipopolysaccharide/colanic/teichoic acid biosynthesis glycosyltransferase
MTKRIFDIILSILLIIILSPLLIIIALIVRIESHGPAIFKQKRTGQYGRDFIIYKFRTMYHHTPKNKASRDLDNREDYITSFGNFLRVTSLDELPQLFNIIKGEMSFVGPRPLILAEKEFHQARKNKGVYQAKPGVTGCAQINGRDHCTFKDKIALDQYYVENQSLWLDIKIIIKTGIKVLKREDIYEHQKADDKAETFLEKLFKSK